MVEGSTPPGRTICLELPRTEERRVLFRPFFFAPGTAEQAGSGELSGVFLRKIRQIRGEERLFPCRSLMPEGIAAHPARTGCVGSQPGAGGTRGTVRERFFTTEHCRKEQVQFFFHNCEKFSRSVIKKRPPALQRRPFWALNPSCQKLFLSGAWAMVMKSFTRLSRLASELPPS